MAAYAIFIRERVRDEARLAAYVGKVAGVATRFGGKVLARIGEVHTVEGPDANGVVLLEFPDLAAAQAWYGSDQYQIAKGERHLGGDFRAILFDGI